VPVYTILTNEQLAEMARRNVSARADLAAINGIGEVKLEKYGARFLAVDAPVTPVAQ